MARDLSIGTIKKSLITQSNVALTGSTGAALGAFSAQRYTNTAGLISLVGSATLQIQLGANSGTRQASSAITDNSGGSSFSFTSFGRVVNVNLNQAASQRLNTIFIYGQP